MGRSYDVACTVEIEQTQESFHAYVELDGDIEIRPGDRVIVHDAPTDVGFGEKRVVRCRATVTPAGFFDRIWTRFASAFEITELYDVSFSDRRRL